MLLIIGIYLLLGLIVTIIATVSEPIILHAWFLLPVFVLIWPYVLWAVFTDDKTGRWI